MASHVGVITAWRGDPRLRNKCVNKAQYARSGGSASYRQPCPRRREADVRGTRDACRDREQKKWTREGAERTTIRTTNRRKRHAGGSYFFRSRMSDVRYFDLAACLLGPLAPASQWGIGRNAPNTPRAVRCKHRRSIYDLHMLIKPASAATRRANGRRAICCVKKLGQRVFGTRWDSELGLKGTTSCRSRVSVWDGVPLPC